MLIQSWCYNWCGRSRRSFYVGSGLKKCFRRIRIQTLHIENTVVFFWLKWKSLLCPEILPYCTKILQCPKIIVGDARFKPGTSVPKVWSATNEPPHLQNPPYVEYTGTYCTQFFQHSGNSVPVLTILDVECWMLKIKNRIGQAQPTFQSAGGNVTWIKTAIQIQIQIRVKIRRRIFINIKASRIRHSG